MSNDLIDTSDTSETPTPNDIVPYTNYSRWMTDIASEIALLKLHQLAIPGSHNSGADRAGMIAIGKEWAANQDNTFPQQLAAGARYLDLRLYDSSYKKTIGNKFPTYKFIEIFEFKHGLSAGRRLEHLVRDVKNFVTANPGEIVILDFYKYDRGRNYAYDSLQRCLPYFTPIKGLLIPPSASDSNIYTIRSQHPGRSIILHLPHNNPNGNWKSEWIQREQIWQSFNRKWRDDATPENIESLVIDSMASPPTIPYWVLDASVYGVGGPMYLNKNHSIRIETFKEGHLNAKILQVDFIERPDTKISVTDNCIALNRRRARDNTKPSAPSNFNVIAKNETVVDGKFQNTLQFKWNPAIDDLGVREYHIYRNDAHFATTSHATYEHQNFALKNYTFKVKAIDNLDNHSDFSPAFDLVQDTIPPTIPGQIFVTRFASYSCIISWGHSIDAAGIQSYELYLNGTLKDIIPYRDSPYASVTYVDINLHQQNEVKIRAKDNNGFYSEYTTSTLYPNPVLSNPTHYIVGYDEVTEKYEIKVVWNVTEHAIFFPDLSYEADDTGQPYYPISGEGPSFSYQVSEGQYISHRCRMINSGEFDRGTPYDFYFSGIRPEPVTNLTITSRTQSGTSLSWTPSTSTNLKNYAISLNEEPPILVASAETTYVFQELPLNESYTVEMWAINIYGACSITESITIEPVDGTSPGAPRNFRFTPFTPNIDWDPPSGTVTGYKIVVTDSLGWSDHYTTDTTSLKPTLRALVSYHVRITAQNNAGESPPLTAYIPAIRPLAPGRPANFRYQQAPFFPVTLHWDKPTGNISWYKIMLRGPGGGEWDFQTPEPKLSTYLIPSARYEVRIIAHNDISGSPPLFAELTTL
jgi:hypothetical protein